MLLSYLHSLFFSGSELVPADASSVDLSDGAVSDEAQAMRHVARMGRKIVVFKAISASLKEVRLTPIPGLLIARAQVVK